MTQLMRHRIAGLEEIPKWVVEKSAARAFCETLGVDTPKVCVVKPSANEIDFGALPDRFVIKPDGFSNDHGVHLLKRLPNGNFLDALPEMNSRSIR